jgi:hypothetical protein
MAAPGTSLGNPTSGLNTAKANEFVYSLNTNPIEFSGQSLTDVR